MLERRREVATYGVVDPIGGATIDVVGKSRLVDPPKVVVMVVVDAGATVGTGAIVGPGVTGTPFTTPPPQAQQY
jgi:hypothetical protein